ncbi:hypothetical protein HUA74_34850 [Myxococcus sp. CA051A]|uniref:hypothetical protein n=1 Tax=Myxococcus sp. CA051A TaxID=2741739 RepID=UPI00157BAED3|nr:hypothetical protein [Myxococcus sp. CA051A]NTX65851.1 hypothetical protein [Myxococcus sp. CA051A]
MTHSPNDLAALAADATDTFRLRLAEALRHQGDPRGEFIQVQCALAKAGTKAAAPTLREREASLLAAHEATWLAELGLLPGDAVFVRGFVDRVTVDASRARGVYARLIRMEPVRALSLRVDLGGSEAELSLVLEEIRRAGLPPSLEQLTIDRKNSWEDIHDDALERRRQDTRTLGLSLDLHDFTRPDAGLALLSIALTSPDTASLESLGIKLTGLGANPLEELLDALERAGPRPSLREWSLEFSSPNGKERIRWVQLHSLARLLALYPRLQTLVLPMTELHAEHVEHPELRELSLHWLGHTPCGPSDLSQWKHAPVPKGTGLQFLREARLPKLERLHIDFQYEWYIAWTPEDLAPLFEAKGLAALRRLELHNCHFGDVLCRELVRMKHVQSLEVLDLTGAILTDGGAEALTRNRVHFPHLTQLICGPWGLSEPAWKDLVKHYPVVSP